MNTEPSKESTPHLSNTDRRVIYCSSNQTTYRRINLPITDEGPKKAPVAAELTESGQ